MTTPNFKPMTQELAIIALTTIAITALIYGYEIGVVAGIASSIAGLGGYSIRRNSVPKSTPSSTPQV